MGEYTDSRSTQATRTRPLSFKDSWATVVRQNFPKGKVLWGNPFTDRNTDI